MYLLIGADFVPTQTNSALFSSGNTEELFGSELSALMHNASYRIFNLETPLCNKGETVSKNGPALKAPLSAVAGYRAAGVDLLTLANNHIMDQGCAGLEETVDALKKNGIAYVGVGNNTEEASSPYVFPFGAKKIGVYACVEHEFSVASPLSPGANPFDPLCAFDHIATLKEQCDYVIVLFHGGKEHYRYPSPDLQSICRRLVEKGADLVVCQHSHCIGCMEEYQGSSIVYGQGNFLFDGNDSDYWKTGLLISLDGDLNISFLPLLKHNNAVRLAQGEYADSILGEFRMRSEEIKAAGFVEKTFDDFANEQFYYYMEVLSGENHSFFFRLFNKLLRGKLRNVWLNRKYNKKSLLKISNYITCEAHREVLLRSVNNKIRTTYGDK